MQKRGILSIDVSLGQVGPHPPRSTPFILAWDGTWKSSDPFSSLAPKEFVGISVYLHRRPLCHLKMISCLKNMPLRVKQLVPSALCIDREYLLPRRTGLQCCTCRWGLSLFYMDGGQGFAGTGLPGWQTLMPTVRYWHEGGLVRDIKYPLGTIIACLCGQQPLAVPF